MKFNELDANSFKAFWFAAETLNFTEAAKRAGLTQSGVSQHVAKLEDQLETELFLRKNRAVLLTSAGKMLLKYIERYFEELELLQEALRSEKTEIRGTVRYAMPSSCILSPHFPLLLEERSRRFPKLEIEVTLCPNPEVLEKLQKNEIDFGFVTAPTQIPSIKSIRFCDENYIMIYGGGMVNLTEIEDLLALEFIEYPGEDILFEHWKRVHFPRSKVQFDGLKKVGSINSIQGVLNMVEAGMGVAIVPEHCADSKMKARAIKAYGDRPCHHPITIVTFEENLRLRRVKTVVDTFLAMHPE